MLAVFGAPARGDFTFLVVLFFVLFLAAMEDLPLRASVPAKAECIGANHEGPRETEERDLCPDGYCRRCHHSLTFESCTSGEWAREVRRAAGLPLSGAP